MNIRIDAEHLSMIDGIGRTMTRATPSLRLSRSEIVRISIREHFRRLCVGTAEQHEAWNQRREESA